MTATDDSPARKEPILRVGLLERQATIELQLPDGIVDEHGAALPAGPLKLQRDKNSRVTGLASGPTTSVCLQPAHADTQPMQLTSRVGAEFHWSEAESLTFAGTLRVEPDSEDLRVINDVPLETYLTAVVASEMSADCPPELIRAHSVVSRSWLLAQLAARVEGTQDWQHNAAGLRWYDQTAHAHFDVCAEDHCQRYHGTGRIASGQVPDAVAATRGQVLTLDDTICDTRYGKCCGGIVEDARVAWSDDRVPYLVPVFDGAGDVAPDVSDEQAFRAFLNAPPDAYCRCDDAEVLDMILPERDRRTTPDFFRWQERLTAEQVRDLLIRKRGIDLGRVTALTPVSRGPSGRLWALRIEGIDGAVTVGKELEIRRVLSESHLKSSAFVVEPEGDTHRPDAFLLRGAGWGHGAGLCQIGAAVMAIRGHAHKRILEHYYPGTTLDRAYA